MSGQDEKVGIIETAKWQYADLMQMLRRVNPENPYSLLPPELERAVRTYENFGAINNSMDFRGTLKSSWERIRVPPALKPELKAIAYRSIFDDGMWGPDPERYR